MAHSKSLLIVNLTKSAVFVKLDDKAGLITPDHLCSVDFPSKKAIALALEDERPIGYLDSKRKVNVPDLLWITGKLKFSRNYRALKLEQPKSSKPLTRNVHSFRAYTFRVSTYA